MSSRAEDAGLRGCLELEMQIVPCTYRVNALKCRVGEARDAVCGEVGLVLGRGAGTALGNNL